MRLDGKSLCRLCICSKMLKLLVEKSNDYINYIIDTEFMRGRLHQFALDYNILIKLEDASKIFTIEQILDTRLYLFCFAKNKTIFRVPSNVETYKGQNVAKNDNFYIGRCIQYICDKSDILIPALLLETKTPADLRNKISIIVDCAHEIRIEIIKPEVCAHNLCTCKKYIFGSDKCSCGKIKLDIQISKCQSLDDKEIKIRGKNMNHKPKDKLNVLDSSLWLSWQDKFS